MRDDLLKQSDIKRPDWCKYARGIGYWPHTPNAVLRSKKISDMTKDELIWVVDEMYSEIELKIDHVVAFRSPLTFKVLVMWRNVKRFMSHPFSA